MIVTYAGKEQCDILYHVIQTGIKLGKTIAVFDNSITHDLFSIYAKDNSEEIIEMDGLVLAKDYSFRREEKAYDFVFVYEGLAPRYYGYTDMAVIAPSYAKAEWDMLMPHAKLCEEREIKTCLILRDKINNKISDRVALAKLDFDPQFMMYTEFNSKDYSSYIALTHNKKAKLNRNGEIYEAVSVLCDELYHMDAKTKKKYL